MSVSRRNLVGRLLSVAAVGTLAWRATAASAEETAVPKVVYHLSDLAKVGFVLGNIDNHIAGMGGPDKVHIVLVVHGPALAQFQASKANPDITRHLAGIVSSGVELGACGNTMKAQKITVADLLPGFIKIDEGGVVRLAQLQAQGYAYIRP